MCTPHWIPKVLALAAFTVIVCGGIAALVDPVFDFLNTTPHRVPMTDWYWTHDATKTGFQARPVVGGVFLRLLYDQAVWK